MVQSALLVALGFLVASLLALLAAPVLWRRAQTVMRYRLEGIVPMSLDAVRADRDALRAEHAMAMRRLEVENEEIRRIDAEHVIEIGGGKEALKARADTIARRDKRIEQLERREEQLTAHLRKRERELSALEVTYRTASREVSRQRERSEQMASTLRRVEGENAERASAIVARDGEVTDLANRLEEARRQVDLADLEASRLRETLAAAEARSARLAEGAPSDRMEVDGPDAAMDLEIALGAAEAKVAALERELGETDGELRQEIVRLSDQVLRLMDHLRAQGGDEPLDERVARLVEETDDDRRPAAMPPAEETVSLPRADPLPDLDLSDESEDDRRTG